MKPALLASERLARGVVWVNQLVDPHCSRAPSAFPPSHVSHHQPPLLASPAALSRTMRHVTAGRWR